MLKQLQSWPKLQYEITSGGHSGQPYVAEVHIDSIATMQSYQQLSTGSELPVGTTIVQLHQDKQGSAGPIYVMEKLQTGWSFSELDPLGHLLREGALANCARCHAEGVADSLFGPLRVLPPTP